MLIAMMIWMTSVQAQCQLYDRLGSELHCLPDQDYIHSYGLPYCLKFSRAADNFTLSGLEWMIKTRTCLQDQFSTIVQSTTNCQEIRNRAFGSHAGCYVASGVCRLPPSDLIVITQIIGLQHLFLDSNALKQQVQTLWGCTRDALDRFGDYLKHHAWPANKQ